MAKLISKTYATAIFEAAVEENILESVKEELNAVSEIFETNPDFFEFYNTPKITISERKQIIENIFVGKVSDYVLNFLKILLDKRRTFHIKDIVADFNQIYDDHSGIVEAIVKSARELSDSEKETLRGKLEEISGKKVKLRNVIDTELIGGLYVSMGNQVIDGSIRKKLDEMKSNILEIIV